MTTGKTIALTRWTFVGKVMSLLFNMLSRLVIIFLPRSKHPLISWLQSPSAVILEPRKIKSATVSTVSPSICHEVMGLQTRIRSPDQVLAARDALKGVFRHFQPWQQEKDSGSKETERSPQYTWAVNMICHTRPGAFHSQRAYNWLLTIIPFCMVIDSSQNPIE